MISTREEKEKLVLDLYNQGKSTREIAQIAHMSFRDIGRIVDKEEKEKEAKKKHAQQTLHQLKPTVSFYKVRLRCKWLLH